MPLRVAAGVVSALFAYYGYGYVYDIRAANLHKGLSCVKIDEYGVVGSNSDSVSFLAEMRYNPGDYGWAIRPFFICGKSNGCAFAAGKYVAGHGLRTG
ncbi:MULTISPECIES: hypothetical protein [unclassified Paludibacterium]|uniref:hypothetical protein n=1 Tax=unclassified Paludibacterium TaxID=2618429 RepID=UPI001C0454F9|nr:hypothetical protein [Paludibacterium sp. B53371]BEV70680.1 hypothetical protein THUN1379_01620 [Paludibacterium sp. THUN1379]